MIITPNLTKKRSEIEQQIRNKYSVLMEQVVAPYSDKERETWPTQLKEADLWLNNNDADVPLINSMAVSRGITVELLVSKIKENESAYRTIIGSILGQQQKELDILYNTNNEIN